MNSHPDVLIIGTGIAGLSAAITAKEAGLDVLVITKADEIQESNTNYAQGGIIAWQEADTPQKLAEDIFRAGCYYNNKEAVSLLANEGPHLVFDFLIDKVHTQFSTNDKNTLDYTEEAAHSVRRILHAQDHTGDVIEASLITYAQKLGIEIKTGWTAIDLITNNHHSTDCQEIYRDREVFGAYVLENSTGIIHTVFASAVILATGGIGNIYQFTTNPKEATGDGIAMAYRAGADIINAEFIQFHPTALYHKDIRRFLISESLRGEGARLLNKKGERFMKKYSPMEELAPRDVVARAIFEEMGLLGTNYVYLDLANYYTGSVPIQERFNKIYTVCKEGGIDITKEPIPVTPAAHYFCGGIKVDQNGKTQLKRLYAIGEVSCTGLHGANRLASTSLLEGLLWGVRSAKHVAETVKPIAAHRLKAIPDRKKPAHPEFFEPMVIYQDWNLIKAIMWYHAGIIRTQKGLDRAFSDLNYHAHRITKFYREAELTRDIIELRNGVETAQIIVRSAMHNTTSIGCHYRKD
ncbi:MAG TPA: L-aspartate oxidase [Spirochaetia bacterium]|nr:L-aspartate oxidase [Spirochaetales bacterium]HRS66195.1 L-aspartate oxidase [Spirochaetia bacterium]HOT59750.1 L-aspartate oxidase [Spirochaetales bacterium]HPD80604.1 L-aspartate oxidase [Spirochaetales bacterium]HQK33303.1 L-aspartate oxidase [Spirochaetales bacterium]